MHSESENQEQPDAPAAFGSANPAQTSAEVSWPQALAALKAGFVEAVKPLKVAKDKVGDWYIANESQIGEVLGRIALFVAAYPRIEGMAAKAKAEGWDHLLSSVDFKDGIALLVALDNDPTHAFEELLEDPLTSHQFIQDVSQALETVAMTNAHMNQLLAGLAFVERHSYDIAVPLLMNPLEGLLWASANDEALVERKGSRMQFAPASGKSGNAGSVETLFKYPELRLEPAFQEFLLRQVYGGSGNPFRHGTAEEGWKLQGLCLVVALVSWLDIADGGHHSNLLSRAFARESNPSSSAN